PWLDEPDATVARLAWEAMASITGLSIADDALTLRTNDDDGIENAVPAPLRDIPRPNAAAIREWWSNNARRFNPTQRYLQGHVVSAAVMEAELRGGPLRRFETLADEVAIRSAGATTFPALRLASAACEAPRHLTFDRPPAWI